MRTIGIVLVVLGALALGYWGFAPGGASGGEAEGQAAEAPERPGGIPPLASGIAVAGGLLLIALAAKRS